MPVKSQLLMWNNLNFWQSDTWRKVQKKIATIPSTQLLPARHMIFKPLMTMRPHEVRVVIIGREPFNEEKPQTCDGYAYSSLRTAPDGRNDLNDLQLVLFNELEDDLGTKDFREPRFGSLIKWVRQGVFLWNWSPTSRYHLEDIDFGLWDALSREIVVRLAEEYPDIVFVPWGIPETQYWSWRDMLPKTALTINTHGPDSPAYKSRFYGSRPFSKINSLLVDRGKRPIDWNTNFT